MKHSKPVPFKVHNEKILWALNKTVFPFSIICLGKLEQVKIMWLENIPQFQNPSKQTLKNNNTKKSDPKYLNTTNQTNIISLENLISGTFPVKCQHPKWNIDLNAFDQGNRKIFSSEGWTLCPFLLHFITDHWSETKSHIYVSHYLFIQFLYIVIPTVQVYFCPQWFIVVNEINLNRSFLPSK